MSELHLFILWEKSRSLEERVLNDIKTNFTIRNIFEIKWEDHLFSSNLSRFYGGLLPAGSGKEKRIGKGTFLLVVVEDTTPKYEGRPRRGKQIFVNINMYDAKMRYRSWSIEAGGVGDDLIHGTNSVDEFRHDITLLLGTSPEQFMATYLQSEEYIEYSYNLVGANGWDSIEQLFTVMNNTMNYVVLRKFECLPNQYTLAEHGDIDFLVYNLTEAVLIMNGTSCMELEYQVQYSITIKNDKILINLRYLGDDYYDRSWERDILKDRVLVNGFYRPCDIDYFYTLFYHAVIHKDVISSDYQERLEQLAKTCDINFSGEETLFKYMNEMLYEIIEPYDKSVCYRFRKKVVSKKKKLKQFTHRVLRKLFFVLGEPQLFKQYYYRFKGWN